METKIQHFKKQIGDKGLSKELFDQISQFVSKECNEYNSQVISLKAQFVELQKDEQYGTVKYEDLSVVKNKISNGLIRLLDEILNPSTSELEKKPKPIFLTRTTRPPLQAKNVLGRADEAKKIAEHFNDNNHLLLINGLGGVGKSTLAGYYMEENQHEYRHIAWVNYTGNLKDDLTREITNYEALKISFNPNTDEMLRRQLTAMSSLPSPNLLIIDNINTQEEVEEVTAFERYFPLGWKILLTSRATSSAFETHEVGVLEESDAIDLFKRFYTFKRTDIEDDLRILLEQVGRHTLAVEMLAKTLKDQGNWDIKKMYENLCGKGLTQLDTGTKVPTAHSQQQGRSLHRYISAIFDINLKSLNDDEKNLLLQFAVLPPFIHSFRHLCQFLNRTSDEEQDALSSQLSQLENKGFLEMHFLETVSEESGAYMHPVLQEVIRGSEKPSYEKCSEIVDFFTIKFYHGDGSKNPVNAFPFLPYGSVLISNIDGDYKEIALLSNNLSSIYLAKGDLDNALKFQNKAITIQEKVLDKDHPDRAQSYNNLSTIYRAKSEFDQALKFQNKAMTIWEKVLDKDHPHLATSYNNLSIIYQAKGNYDHALKFQMKDIDIAEKVRGRDHPYLATSYNNLSIIYQAKGDLNYALKFQIKAVTIREKVLDKDHPDRAQSYNNLATIYYQLAKYRESGKWIEQAIAILKKNFPDGHPNLDVALASQKVIKIRMSAEEK